MRLEAFLMRPEALTVQDLFSLVLFFLVCICVLYLLIQIVIWKSDGWRYEHRPYVSRRKLDRMKHMRRVRGRRRYEKNTVARSNNGVSSARL